VARRKVYLYRLRVTLPPEAAEPGWEPQAWLDDDYRGDFRWPETRLYLSGGWARRRANLFRKYGAQVTIERSAPVTWPDYADG
jgi:hypothetical protein